MPTYEYRCPAGHEFDRFYRTISAAAAQLECPQCGQVAERRVSGGGTLLFKGSGFYITDYGKDGKKAEREATAKKSAESSSGSSSEGSSGGSSSSSGSSPSGGTSESKGSGEGGSSKKST